MKRQSLLAVEGLETRRLLSSITLHLSESSSPGGDFVGVVKSRVGLVGQTNSGSTVELYRASGRNAMVLVGKTTADADGAYHFKVESRYGANSFIAKAAVSPGHFASTQLTVNRANEAIVWNTISLQSVRNAKLQAPDAARAYAIVSLSIFDAVNAVHLKYASHGNMFASHEADPAAAVDLAAYTSLVGLFPAQKTMLAAELATTLSAVPRGRARSKGIILGTSVANRILDLRAADGSTARIVNEPIAGPDVWVPTPPGFAPPVDPQWGNVKPFALTSGSQFQPPAPPSPTSAEFAADVAQVKTVGNVNSTVRTADQTASARFWSDLAGTFDPPGHWNQIADLAAMAHHLNLEESAHTLALVDIALADAGIEAWGVKYRYDTARPVTVIRNGLGGINPSVTADPSWTPLWATPPFPSYISGHSTFSAAAATVLDSVYGKKYAFTDLGDPTLNIAPRHFASFDAAAQEAGMSRIYGGIHYEADNLAGLVLGGQVGRYVIGHELHPLKSS